MGASAFPRGAAGSGTGVELGGLAESYALADRVADLDADGLYLLGHRFSHPDASRYDTVLRATDALSGVWGYASQRAAVAEQRCGVWEYHAVKGAPRAATAAYLAVTDPDPAVRAAASDLLEWTFAPAHLEPDQRRLWQHLVLLGATAATAEAGALTGRVPDRENWTEQLRIRAVLDELASWRLTGHLHQPATGDLADALETLRAAASSGTDGVFASATHQAVASGPAPHGVIHSLGALHWLMASAGLDTPPARTLRRWYLPSQTIPATERRLWAQLRCHGLTPDETDVLVNAVCGAT